MEVSTHDTEVKNQMDLYEDVRSFLRGGGVDFFGVAPIGAFDEAEPGFRPQEILPSVKSILVYGCRMFEFPRLGELGRENIPLGITEYTANFFIAAGMLDHLSYRIAMLLQDRGFKSLPIPAGPPYDGVRLRGLVSHKFAAEKAGLGSRGLCDLFLTATWGPRVRLATLLTEAEFPVAGMKTGDLCQSYRSTCGLACVQACPVQAISVEKGLDKWHCDRFNEIILSKGPVKIRCGRCMSACPIGK